MVRLHSPLPWEFSSAGRASALQAGGHRFEPCNSHQHGPVVQLVRMPACHAGGRQFEPDPDRQMGLQSAGMRSVVYKSKNRRHLRRHSQVVRQRSAKPLFPGSNPGVASISAQPMKLIAVGIVKWLRQRVVAPLCVGSNPTIHPISVGVSPSGKAMDSDSIMRRFESCYPSQMQSSEEKSPELCHLAENPVIPTIPAVSKRLTQRPLLLIETTFSGDLSPKWEMK